MDDDNGIPAVPLAKEAVSTYPAVWWGPDETLHAWEIVMFGDLLITSCSPFPARQAQYNPQVVNMLEALA